MTACFSSSWRKKCEMVRCSDLAHALLRISHDLLPGESDARSTPNVAPLSVSSHCNLQSHRSLVLTRDVGTAKVSSLSTFTIRILHHSVSLRGKDARCEFVLFGGIIVASEAILNPHQPDLKRHRIKLPAVFTQRSVRAVAGDCSLGGRRLSTGVISFEQLFQAKGEELVRSNR